MESNKALAETICCAFRNSPIVCNHCGIQIVHRQVQEQEHAQTCNVNGTSNQAVAPAPSSQPQTSHTAIGFATARNLNQLATSNPLPQAMTAPAATVEHQYYKQYQQCYQQYPRAYDPYQHQQYYPYQQQLAQQVQQLPQPQVQQQVQAPMPQVLPQPHFHPQPQPHFHPQPQPHFHPQPQPQVLPQPHFHPQPQPHFHPQPQPQLINSQLPPASHPPYPSQPHQQIQHVPPQQHPLQVQPPFGSLPPQFPPPPPLPHMMPPQQRPITHQVQQPVPPPYMQQPQVFPGQTPSQLQVQPQAHQHLPQSIVQQASTNGVFDAASDFSSGLRKKPDTLSCEICNITCTCSEDLEKHIAGKKHQKKLEESNQGHGVKLVCELCRVTCNTSDMLKNHMSGRNHQKNLEKSKKLIGANPKRKKIESDDDKCVSDDEPETKKHDAMASCKLQAGSKGLQALYPKKQ